MPPGTISLRKIFHLLTFYLDPHQVVLALFVLSGGCMPFMMPGLPASSQYVLFCVSTCGQCEKPRPRTFLCVALKFTELALQWSDQHGLFMA